MSSCSDAIGRGLAGQIIPGISANEIASRISDVRNRFIGEGQNVSGPEGSATIADQVVSGYKADAKRAQLVAAFDLQTITSKVDWISTHFADRPDVGLKALMVGEAKANFGSRASVDLAQKTASQGYRGELISHLRDADLVNSFIVGGDEFEQGVYLAARRKAAGESVDDLPDESVRVANILEQLQTSRRNEANRAGANIEELVGRVTRQSHDTWRIRKASTIINEKTDPSFGRRAKSAVRRGATSDDADAWVGFVMDNLDHRATFPERVLRGGQAAKEAWLSETYDGFANGFQPGYTDNPLAATRRGTQPAFALEQERVLHFTPEGEFEYMRTFGHGSLKETVFAEIDMMGFRLGLMNTLGLNPYANLQSIVKGVRNRSRGDALTKLDRYASGFEAGHTDSKLGRHYLTVSGATNRVVSDVGALIGSSVRSFEYVTKLGFSALSSINDVANMAADLQGLQGSYAVAMHDAMLAPMEGLSKGAKRDFAESTGFGLDTMIGASFDRFGAIDSPSGLMSKGMSTYFKFNLLGPWTDAARRGHYVAVSRHMSKEFSKDVIGDRYVKALREYQISESDISLVKSNLTMADVDGESFFDANKIKDIPSEKFELSSKELSQIQAQVNRLPADRQEGAAQSIAQNLQLRKRDQLTTKFSSFFIDRNDMGVLTPDASTRSLVQQGRGRGDPLRELSEMFFQFKQFPVAMMQVLMRRHVANRELGALSFHIGALTGLGAVSMMLKDFFKGREMFIPQTKEEGGKYMMSAFLNGGAAGLYGDFILGEADGLGTRFLRLFGPAANDALDYSVAATDQVKRIFDTDDYDGQAGSSLWKAVRNDIPAANLFYTKAFLDYTVLYWLAETISPGFLDKQEAGVERSRSGRGSIVPPRDVVPVGGLRSL